MSASKPPDSAPRRRAPDPDPARAGEHTVAAPARRSATAQELALTRAELEQSRARYFELFDFAPIPYFTFKPDGVIDRLNLAAAELLHVERNAAIGTAFSSHLEDTARAAFRAHVAAVFDKPGSHTLELALAPTGVAARRHLHVVSRLIRGEMSDHPLCLSAVLDITARKSTEEETARINAILEQRVEQRTRELEENNKEMESFIYSISHDLRAPLRNMAGFSNIIAEDFSTQVPTEVLGYVKRIQAGNEKMLRLVDDLLRFSRLGRKPLDLAPVDLNLLLDEALSDLGAELEGRDVQWHRKPLPIAECDRGLMRQVFVNFLSNALKYSRPRKPAVITIGTQDRDGQRVVFIQDNGVGFDPRYKDKLFGVFQRLHTPSEFEGNGVGLAMAARILHRHGGEAFADGAVDQGATFWFTFAGLKKAV